MYVEIKVVTIHIIVLFQYHSPICDEYKALSLDSDISSLSSEETCLNNQSGSCEVCH